MAAHNGIWLIKKADEIIKGIDLCIEKNGQEHHTWKYSHMRKGDKSNLVIRRGQYFQIKILLNCPYHADDIIHFTFQCDDTRFPNFKNGSLVVVALSKSDDDSLHSWTATLESHEDNVLIVDIRPSPHCIISKWQMKVSYKRKKKTTSIKLKRKVYILFNPWCESDQVYMQSDEWREEAVLNTEGMIWNKKTPLGMTWNYAQFNEDILDCALYLIGEFGRLPIEWRSNPIDIARKLSAMMNNNDDNGVLVGNWTKNYYGGVAPTTWTGSRDILRKYYHHKSPVKYGQCWVFGGILTTVCRAIGIPSRVVTNFVSGHDANGSVTIDSFIDNDGKPKTTADSTWTFHVWSEVWMKRPDLGADYDGWQVVDSTPQEQSHGIFRCGPASVAAVKHGDIKKPYDTDFVFAEVNADTAVWKIDPAGNYQLVRKWTDHIGKFISTKAAGKFVRLDLTDDYKFTEGSPKERAIVMKALRQVDHRLSKIYIGYQFNDLIFELKKCEEITVGESFDVILVMTNTNDSITYKVTTTLRLDILSYTGKYLHTAKVKKALVVLQKRAEVQFTMPVVFYNYKDDLVDNCFFMISCLASVENTNFSYYDMDNIQIKKPDVEIKIIEEGKVGERNLAAATLRNPLPIALHNGMFLVEAPGIRRIMKIKWMKKKILPRQQITQQFLFTPQIPGLQIIAVKFVSKELDDIEGFLQIHIDP